MQLIASGYTKYTIKQSGHIDISLLTDQSLLHILLFLKEGPFRGSGKSNKRMFDPYKLSHSDKMYYMWRIHIRQAWSLSRYYFLVIATYAGNKSCDVGLNPLIIIELARTKEPRTRTVYNLVRRRTQKSRRVLWIYTRYYKSLSVKIIECMPYFE